MANTLIPGWLGYEFELLAKRKAKLSAQENKLVEKFNIKTDDQTIQEVFEIIANKGKPAEKGAAQKIKDKYDSGEQLEFDEIFALDKLYKACGSTLPNKEDDDE